MTYRALASRSASVSLATLLALCAGCNGGTTSGSDAGMTADTGAADTGSSDAGMADSGASDTGTGDAGSLDAGSDDAATIDASADDAGAPTDGGIPTDAFNAHDAAAPVTDAAITACGYVAVDEVVVRCGADYVFVSHFTSDMAGCAPFYAFDPEGTHFADTATAIASDATCDAHCEWHFATSVSRIHCGHRDGYETLSATGAGCADLYRFAEGYFPSVEAHDTAYPCP